MSKNGENGFSPFFDKPHVRKRRKWISPFFDNHHVRKRRKSIFAVFRQTLNLTLNPSPGQSAELYASRATCADVRYTRHEVSGHFKGLECHNLELQMGCELYGTTACPWFKFGASEPSYLFKMGVLGRVRSVQFDAHA